MIILLIIIVILEILFTINQFLNIKNGTGVHPYFYFAAGICTIIIFTTMIVLKWPVHEKININTSTTENTSILYLFDDAKRKWKADKVETYLNDFSETVDDKYLTITDSNPTCTLNNFKASTIEVKMQSHGMYKANHKNARLHEITWSCETTEEEYEELYEYVEKALGEPRFHKNYVYSWRCYRLSYENGIASITYNLYRFYDD